MLRSKSCEEVKMYRKIPSLLFLYEISKKGKVRNVKSKRIVESNNGLIYLKNPRFPEEISISSLINETWNEKLKEVIVDGKHFESLADAARYIKTDPNVTITHKNIMDRMYNRRTHILGHNIKYII